MSIQHQSAATLATSPADAVTSHAVVAAAIAAVRRGAPQAALTHALVTYWQQVARTDLSGRREWSRALRHEVGRGADSSRAWCVVALGDPDFDLVRAAVHGYVGVGPTSVERREHAVADACEWLQRGHALNAAAVFVALLELRDPLVNERLVPLRHRLESAARDAVWSACAAATDPLTLDFVAEWQASA